MTVVGTRPEIIRLSRVVARLDSCTNHTLVHTGQNYDYELNEIFFTDLQLTPPSYYLGAAGRTPAETIGQVIIKTDEVLEQVRPEALLILGDTNSSLAALPAKRRRIPVFHMEAGNRCFDERVPEEINRRIVDHISDVNLPYSAISREYLLREGLPADRVIKTGSPMNEVLTHYRTKIDASSVLDRLGLIEHEYFVVSCHREENVDSPARLQQLAEMLAKLPATFDQRVIVATHPRTRKRLDGIGFVPDPRVQLIKPLGFTDFVRLQVGARAVLSDSGTITEEASILGIQALNIREAHERPEGMEEAAVIMTGLEWTRICQGLDMLTQTPHSREGRRVVSDYDVPNVSEKVARIILSYTDYVRRVVWRE
jgi:UDP-N-acetylglucosamine 2-epimerase (non-hydrolysing)